jgi:urease subunit beta
MASKDESRTISHPEHRPSGPVGGVITKDEEIICFPNRRTVKITVKNTGDRPIQVGSHFHFFEANRALEFDREKAYGMKLNIPSGTAVRIEPGDAKELELVEFGGEKRVIGFNGIVMGGIRGMWVKQEALKKARELGFKGA